MDQVFGSNPSDPNQRFAQTFSPPAHPDSMSAGQIAPDMDLTQMDDDNLDAELFGIEGSPNGLADSYPTPATNFSDIDALFSDGKPDDVGAFDAAPTNGVTTADDDAHVQDTTATVNNAPAAPVAAAATDPRIPDLTQAHITTVPHLTSLYETYAAGYADPTTPPEEHLRRAETLARALLSHYYPASQGFTIAQHAYEVSAPYGMAWELRTPRPKNDPFNYIPAIHSIPPHLVSGYCVFKNYLMTDGTWLPFPHTYVAIAIDTLKNYHDWVPVSKEGCAHRGDVLAYSLGVTAEIAKGYGFLIVGPRVEAYKYDANDGRMPIRQWAKSHEGGKWAVDMRYGGVGELDRLVKDVLPETVRYKNTVFGEGVKF
ncbi:hypothetical protein BS50DRAFT_211476 [Corynespora cassiicola Philippines]|uniref:Uncharacterized protein n=1 Tax=Corynespora cassiicola Philippines TaxID=1448308 RepID=A0A2T2N5B4_CORCC|nr:hypothetical protein BS50DRAFT_211476 [Corynespora cassiicola Philippines]